MLCFVRYHGHSDQEGNQGEEQGDGREKSRENSMKERGEKSRESSRGKSRWEQGEEQGEEPGIAAVQLVEQKEKNRKNIWNCNISYLFIECLHHFITYCKLQY